MLRITAADVKGDKDLIRYISEESDESDEEKVLAKHSDREPIITPDIRFGNVVIVVGIPKVSADKTKKLMAVLVRKFASEFEKNGIRTLPNSNNFDMITDNDGNSLGIAFLTMSNDKEALEAAEILKGYQLDAKHRFSAATTPQIEDILNRSPDYVPPQPIQGITREQNRWWLEDPRSRAQFFVRRDQETEIFWHDPLEKEPVLICNRVKDKDSARKVWTDLRAQWSTHGSYFATFHRPGVALWSGPEFDKKIRLEHPGVKQIEFSPRENYAVTWDGTSASQKVSSAIIIWRVITGTALKTLPTPNRTPRGVGTKYIAWSHDDRFCSLFENDEICVYELPNMTQVHEIEKKTSPVNYQSEKFDWSPATDMIAIWCPGSIDTPGRLQITRMPTRQEVTSKNVYSVGEAAIHWHPHGKYLCLRATVTRKTGKKSKKGLTQLEIFRMEEKDIPVDTVTIEDLPIKQFHWEEGNSDRFAIIVRDDTTQAQQIRMYQVSAAGNQRDTSLIALMDLSPGMNYMKWCPNGVNFIIAAIERIGVAPASPNATPGTLHFCALTDSGQIEVLHKDDHYLVNDIKWSSCGRYLITAVCMPLGVIGPANLRLEQWSGYAIWTFQGKNQYRLTVEKLYQVGWRPEPPTLLKPSQLEELKRNLKEYGRRFDEIDEKLENERKSIRQKERDAITAEFVQTVAELLEWQKSMPNHAEWTNSNEIFSQNIVWEEKTIVTEVELDYKEEVIGT